MTMQNAPEGAKIVYIPPDKVPAVWIKFADQINRALSQGAGDSTNSALVYQSLISGDANMLAAAIDDRIKACLIYSIQRYPAKVTVLVEVLAGRDLYQWFDDYEHALEAIRKEAGADTIEAICRPGLQRMLKNWHYKATLMELPKHGRQKRRRTNIDAIANDS